MVNFKNFQKEKNLPDDKIAPDRRRIHRKGYPVEKIPEILGY